MSIDKKAFKKITSKTHTEQAIWFLNGFWNEGASENAEDIWEACHTMMEIQMGIKIMYGRKLLDDEKDVKERNDIDQFQAHRFLEHFGETKTASQLRRELKTIDLDKDNRLCLSEYLVSKYNKTVADLISAPQGSSTPEQKAALAAAEAKIKECSDQLNVAQEEAKKAADALEASNQAEAKLKEAQDAVAAALAELEAEEKKYHGAIAKQESIIADDSKGGVARNRARATLAQLKSEDPLPLSRAKITQAAALKKAKKQTKKAGRARNKAQGAAMSAANAQREAEAVLKATEEAFNKLRRAMGGTANGQLWWMERKMKEIKKFMPKGKKRRAR